MTDDTRVTLEEMRAQVLQRMADLKDSFEAVREDFISLSDPTWEQAE